MQLLAVMMTGDFTFTFVLKDSHRMQLPMSKSKYMSNYGSLHDVA